LVSQVWLDESFVLAEGAGARRRGLTAGLGRRLLRRRRGRRRGAGSARGDRAGKLGQAGDEQPLGQAGQEQCLPDAGGGDLIAEAVRDALDEPVDAEPSQVVSAGSDATLMPAAEYAACAR
jgi:hypothetical protein